MVLTHGMLWATLNLLYHSASPGASLLAACMYGIRMVTAQVIASRYLHAPLTLGEKSTFLGSNVFRPDQGKPLTIGFKAKGDGWVTVRIFNVAGELVQPVAEMDAHEGVIYAASWDGLNLAGQRVSSGIYFVSIKGAGIRSIRKVVLLK